MIVKTEVKSAMRLDFDSEETDDEACGGFSVMSDYLLTNTSNAVRKDVHFEFTKKGSETNWTVKRNICDIFRIRPVHTEESFTTFTEFVSALKGSEKMARKHFIDYLVEELEEELSWDDSCRPVLDEVMRYREAEKAKEEPHA